MDKYEEYLLRVLRRTFSGLQDSLIPAHAAKMKQLMQNLEQAPSLTGEVQQLTGVQGFTKCALAMEWLLERAKQIGEFSPEQFESDILLLNEKLFEAFLNQPFDMPDFGRPDTIEASPRAVQKNIQASVDEFFPTSVAPVLKPQPVFDEDAEIGKDGKNKWESPVYSSGSEWAAPVSTPKAFEAEVISSSPAKTGGTESSPPLADAMDVDLYEMMERMSQNIVEFASKMPNERPIAMAVIRVAARTAGETARTAGNMLVEDFVTAFLKVISYVDEQGKIRGEAFGEIMRDIGDRLAIALKQPSGGVTLLTNLTKFIEEPKNLFSK